MEASSGVELTVEERATLDGREGPLLQKVMKSVVLYCEAVGARKLVPITHGPHLVLSVGSNALMKPYFDMVDELVTAGIQVKWPFTTDPRPTDPAMKYSLLERATNRLLFGQQRAYEQQLSRLGLKDDKAFSCACYLPELGNTPKKGDVLVWSESSAVVFANSVLGARTNRNSAGIDLLCNIVGKAPYMGLLTGEGRRATLRVELKTSKLPNPQLLGGAIGSRAGEEVPYIAGLDRLLGRELNDTALSYLKDMGAASAATGAVGLYHAEGLTPEAVDSGRELLAQDHKVYAIDDAELQRVYGSYPVQWRRKDARPERCLIGCPHLDLRQLRWWARAIPDALRKANQSHLKVETYLCSAPDVIERFKQSGSEYQELAATGAKVVALCPLTYLTNPVVARRPVLTNSGKLRAYSSARFYPDEELLDLAVRGSP